MRRHRRSLAEDAATDRRPDGRRTRLRLCRPHHSPAQIGHHRRPTRRDHARPRRRTRRRRCWPPTNASGRSGWRPTTRRTRTTRAWRRSLRAQRVGARFGGRSATQASAANVIRLPSRFAIPTTRSRSSRRGPLSVRRSIVRSTTRMIVESIHRPDGQRRRRHPTARRRHGSDEGGRWKVERRRARSKQWPGSQRSCASADALPVRHCVAALLCGAQSALARDGGAIDPPTPAGRW